MEFVARSFAQVSDLFRSLTPGARIASALLLVMVVVGLAYLFNGPTAGPDAYLLGGEPLDAGEIGSILAALGKAQLTGYEIEGNRIKVPRGQEARYMAALADENAMPAGFGSHLDRAVQATSPFKSKAQQIEELKLAKQKELQQIIRHMNGIERASVLYDIQTKRGLNQENLVTASVSVKPSGTMPLDEERASSVRRLVAASIAGLKPEHVTLTDISSGKRFGGGGSGVLGGASEDPYVQRKREYEREWTNKIAQALSLIKNAVVTVNVELATETAQEENITSYEKDAVVVRSRESTMENTREGGSPGGRPGVAAQAPNQPAQVGAAPAPKSSESTSDVEKSFGVPITQKRTVRHGLTPKAVTVAVAVPSSYYEEVWTQRNPTTAGQPAQKPDVKALDEIKKQVERDVQNTVVQLLPPMADATVDKFPRVQVTSFQAIPGEPLPVESVSSDALDWLSRNWSTLAVAGLALVSLLMLRSLVRSAPAQTATATSSGISMPVEMAAATAAASAEQAATVEEAHVHKSRLKRRGITGPSLRDELAELVKQDPDTAVSVLRNWISNAT